MRETNGGVETIVAVDARLDVQASGAVKMNLERTKEE
jgi:hypothetical protein